MVVNESSNKSLGFFHLILFQLQAEIDIITKPNFIYIYIYIYICKDLIWLESKTGMDPGPRSPNNEFIECRKES